MQGIRSRDPSFSVQESRDFVIRVFALGECWGKGKPLTDAERIEYMRMIEEDVQLCIHTGLPVHFYTSFLFEMASPDRTVWRKTKKKGKVVYDSYSYSDPLQRTVRSSWWANLYFCAEPFRDAFLYRRTRPLLTEDDTLNFAPLFAIGDEATERFNTVPLLDRPSTFKNTKSKLSEVKLKQMYSNMKVGGSKNGKPSVCDLKSWRELRAIIGAQGSVSTVTGLDWTKETLSPDRTFIGTDHHYDWDIQIMGWNDNRAKAAGRFIFQSQATMDEWIAAHSKLEGMSNHQVVNHELRIRYVALLETYHERVKREENERLKQLKASGELAEEEEEVEDYEVVGHEDDLMDDLMDDLEDDLED